MKMLPQVLFWLGLASVPFAWPGMVLWVGYGNYKASPCWY